MKLSRKQPLMVHNAATRFALFLAAVLFALLLMDNASAQVIRVPQEQAKKEKIVSFKVDLQVRMLAFDQGCRYAMMQVGLGQIASVDDLIKFCEKLTNKTFK